MRLSLKKSAYTFLVLYSAWTLTACTTTQTDLGAAEEAVVADSEESKSLADVEASSGVTIEEPTAEENAALAAASSGDFNDPKDVQLNTETTTPAPAEVPAETNSQEVPVDMAALDTPTETPAQESSAPVEGASVEPGSTGVEGSSLDSPAIADEQSMGLSMDSSSQTIAPILFGNNKTKIARPYRKQLNELAKTLKDDCKAKIIVSGHSDSRGNAKYNKRLALKRAKAVKSYLISRGVKSKQIQIESHGSDKLIAYGTTAEEQAQNRRVEIQMLAH